MDGYTLTSLEKPVDIREEMWRLDFDEVQHLVRDMELAGVETVPELMLVRSNALPTSEVPVIPAKEQSLGARIMEAYTALDRKELGVLAAEASRTPFVDAETIWFEERDLDPGQAKLSIPASAADGIWLELAGEIRHDLFGALSLRNAINKCRQKGRLRRLRELFNQKLRMIGEYQPQTLTVVILSNDEFEGLVPYIPLSSGQSLREFIEVLGEELLGEFMFHDEGVWKHGVSSFDPTSDIFDVADPFRE